MHKSVFVSLFLLATAACSAPFEPGAARQCHAVCNPDGTACACEPDGGFPTPSEGGYDVPDPTPPEAGKPDAHDAGPVDDAGHADATPPDAGPDAPAPVCLTDLSGVGTGDFSVHLTVTTTEAGLTVALLSQRAGCDEMSSFWEVTLSPTAGVVAATDDGTPSDYAFAEAGNSINDGKPHKVTVSRIAGQLRIFADGSPISAATPDTNDLGTLPPLATGTSACTGTSPAASNVTISDVCITRP